MPWKFGTVRTEIAACPCSDPADPDWALIGPFEFDRALVRNTLTNELSRQIGQYAPRTRFVEVFYNKSGGNVSEDDYVGLYFLTERVTRGEDRVDIAAIKTTTQ